MRGCTAIGAAPATLPGGMHGSNPAPRTRSHAAMIFSASGAAASCPTSRSAPELSKFPSQTTTVRRGVTAAHHASRCPLLVPVFQAIPIKAASGQTRAVRSGSARQPSVARHAVGERAGPGSIAFKWVAESLPLPALRRRVGLKASSSTAHCWCSKSPPRPSPFVPAEGDEHAKPCISLVSLETGSDEPWSQSNAAARC